MSDDIFLPRLGDVVAPRADAAPADFKKDVLPVLTKYCTKCHGGAKPSGSFRLDNVKDVDAAMKRPKAWEKVAEALRSSEMPPPEKPRPTIAEMDAVNGWIDAAIFKVDCNGPRPRPGDHPPAQQGRVQQHDPRPPRHRFQAGRRFPQPTTSGYGFDNIGDVLSLPPLLMEKYLTAAEQIARRRSRTTTAKQALHEPAGQARQGRRTEGPHRPALLRRARLAPAG